MPNMPQDENITPAPSPILNGVNATNGYDVVSEYDDIRELIYGIESDDEAMQQINGINRIEENVWIHNESSANEEPIEGSEDENPQEQDQDAGEKAPFFGDSPVYLRRYQFVSDLLKNPQWTRDIKRLVDIGANNCEFLYRLRNNGGMQHLREAIALDVDETTLEWNRKKTEPLNVGNLLKDHMRRFYPLDVYHIAGSVGDKDARLKNVDAVTAIELIEHLYPETLAAFPRIVFEHMKPKLVVITTPNRDFNVLFPNFEGPFRHWDHKFEFTREEFYKWANTITENYPEYSVTFDGVGEQPLNIEYHESLGFCSQIAIFMRKDFEIEAKNGCFANRERGSYLDLDLNLVQKHSEMIHNSDLYPYKVVVHHRAEHMPDERSMELRCYHALNSHIKELSSLDYEYFSKDEEVDVESINPKIYYHRIQNHLKEYCYDDYGHEYKELNEETVSQIFAEYKEDFIVGHDDEGVYFQVSENYWNASFESSDDESTYGDNLNRSDQESANLFESENENCSSNPPNITDWSDSDQFDNEQPVVPPAILQKDELWSDDECQH